MTRRRLFILASILLFLPCTGCHQMAVLLANMQGGDVIKPEFKLDKGPLLILPDDPRGLVNETKAIRELHETIADNFLRNKVNNRVIPFRELQRLQREDSKYDRYSAREIGEKLGADQVLYLKVDNFSLYSEAGAPLFKGVFAVRVKVLTTEPKGDVRLWPREESGRLMSVDTRATPTDGDKSAADVATELGVKLGQRVAGLFYEHKEFAD